MAATTPSGTAPKESATHDALRAATLGAVPTPRHLQYREAVYRRLLGAADALAGLAVLAACTLATGRGLQVGALVVAPLIVGLAKILGLYDRDDLLVGRRTLDEAPSVFQVATLAAFIAWLLGDLVSRPSLDRLDALVLWLGLWLGLLLARMTARRIARRHVHPARLLLLGDADVAERLAMRLGARGAVLVGRIPLREEVVGGTSAIPVLGALPTLSKTVSDLQIDRVVLAPAEEHSGTLDLVRAIKTLGVRVSVLPRLLEAVGSSAEWDDLDGMPLLGLRAVGLTRSSSLVKRVFDLGGAILFSLVAIPVATIIAIAVKLDGRGPVLFGQRRVGRNGETFCMWKFRTMCADAEGMKEDLRSRNEAGEGMFKLADDPRVTRVGRYLRRTSLDELPQLLNVLRGEMSLVGPRPLLEEEDKRVEGWYRRRLHLTPGMTGRWQILANRVPLREMVVLDYLYVADWSLWADVKILLRTLPKVIGRTGM